MKKPFTLTLIFAAINATVFAQAGSLDKSFGNNGITITDFNQQSFDIATSMAHQPDGKILLAGTTAVLGRYNLGLIRYSKDGKPDNTFGLKGRAIADINSSRDDGYSIALQPDGKIVVAGTAAF